MSAVYVAILIVIILIFLFVVFRSERFIQRNRYNGPFQLTYLNNDNWLRSTMYNTSEGYSNYKKYNKNTGATTYPTIGSFHSSSAPSGEHMNNILCQGQFPNDPMAQKACNQNLLSPVRI